LPRPFVRPGRLARGLAVLGALVVPATAAAAADAAPPAPAVRTGLDVVVSSGGAPLRGKRVGLVVNAASVTADGRHAIDALRQSGVQVVRLFAPEHGLRNRAAAGEKIEGGVDGHSGLPVVSLYGARTKPTAADLAGLDVLVYDLQDAGVRFYTYASTLLLCLEAAGESGVELIVLDRPNPLGGDRMEGPQRSPEVATSLVSMAPGPLVHGLTLGEMARLVNARRSRPARLDVVALKGWARSMMWVDTGLRWVAPSPNLRSPEAALAYGGTALLEATNLSEGRGTEAPFLLLGAPWLSTEPVVRAVQTPGFALLATRFTPVGSSAAPEPKHRDSECAGLQVRITDARAARPYELGMRLLHELRKQGAFGWREDGALDWLLGTRAPRMALERGDPVEAILAADLQDIEAFRRERQPALLY